MKWRCVTAVIVLQLTGCQSGPSVEKRLLAAGFVQRPAQAQELSTLPPYRIMLQSQGKQATYVYADPAYCRCLYVGDSHAYGKFHYLTALQHEADQEKATAAMEQNAPYLNFMEATSPPPYWYPSYYPYYYPTVFSGMGYYSPGWNYWH